jgi:hypothetical protein
MLGTGTAVQRFYTCSGDSSEIHRTLVPDAPGRLIQNFFYGCERSYSAYGIVVIPLKCARVIHLSPDNQGYLCTPCMR